MALFRRSLPRRAVAGAFIGFLYGILNMGTQTTQGFAAGAGWCLLSLALLFARPFAYYAFITWALLWLAWKGVEAFQGAGNLGLILDAAIALLALVLLSSSGYVQAVERPPGDVTG